MGALIDTSVFVAAERNETHSAWCLERLANVTDGAISPIVVSELRVGVETVAGMGLIAAARSATLETALRLPCLPITAATAALHAQLASSLRGRGSVRTRTHDVWLAATAIEHGIPLLTCNRRDFADIVGLKLIAPE